MQLHLDAALNAACYQYFTPEWAAVELVERHFPNLQSADLVLEPACGLGAFLKAIPVGVRAIGVELDPDVAQLCRANTNREVIVGDFRTIALPPDVTIAVGNPPFSVHLIQALLLRLTSLPNCRECGMILPAYALQTHNTVERWRASWSMLAEIVPRRLFPRLRLPLAFVKFTRNKNRSMVGFALYDQAIDIEHMRARFRVILETGIPRTSMWRALVESVMGELGEASLPEIYAAIQPKRPTPNPWWREKVRQILQLHFDRVGPARYRRCS